MQIYIAATLKDFEYANALANDIEGLGHSITFKWWEHIGDLSEETKAKLAIEEYEAVLACELLIFIPPGARGSHFELGVAYTNDKLIYAIEHKEGWKESVFHYLPGIEVYNIQDLLDNLKEAN